MQRLRLSLEGSEPPLSFQLHERVYLVGSASTCGLCVPGLPDELFQLWQDEAGYRLVRMEEAEGPEPVLVNGATRDELVLRPGDVIEWRGIRLSMSDDLAVAASRPAPTGAMGQAPSAPPTPASSAPASSTPVARLAAAAWAAQNGKVERTMARKWEGVLRAGGNWDALGCAQEVLDQLEQRKGIERAAAVSLRDGLARRLIQQARSATSHKRFLARLIVQLFVLLVVGGMVLGLVLVGRQSWGWDLNGVLDGCLRVIEDISGWFS